MSTTEITREKIPWYPIIDYDKCTGDMECYNFCKNDVFIWDKAEDRPIVKNPYNCVLGCSTCAKLCPAEAISFMTIEELRETMRKLRAEVQT